MTNKVGNDLNRPNLPVDNTASVAEASESTGRPCMVRTRTDAELSDASIETLTSHMKAIKEAQHINTEYLNLIANYRRTVSLILASKRQKRGKTSVKLQEGSEIQISDKSYKVVSGVPQLIEGPSETTT